MALIGIGGTVLGTAVGFVLNFAYERIPKKARMKNDLQAAINRALLVTVVNKYPVFLGEFKEAIDTNAHVLHKNKSITSFYSK